MSEIRETLIKWLAWILMVEQPVIIKGSYVFYGLVAVVGRWIGTAIYYRLPKVKARRIPGALWYHRILYWIPAIKTIGQRQYLRGVKWGSDWGVREGFNMVKAKGKLSQRKINRAVERSGG